MEDVAPAGGGPHAAPHDARLIQGRSVRTRSFCSQTFSSPPVVPMQLVHTPQLRTRNRCARIAARVQHLL